MSAGTEIVRLSDGTEWDKEDLVAAIVVRAGVIEPTARQRIRNTTNPHKLFRPRQSPRKAGHIWQRDMGVKARKKRSPNND